MLAKPFISKKKTRLESFTIKSLFGVRSKTGKVGLEVEVEGNGFPKSYEESGDEDADGEHLIPYQWRYTHDGSLRGYDNAEYILVQPLEFHKVGPAVDDLWQMFKDYGSKLDESNRTSVHVHLNVQEFRLNRLCAFAGLWFCVEDLLTKWCGDHRVGNMFCLRANDAPAIVSKLRKLVTKGDIRGITNDDGLHYAGFNTQALAKFGSIEIRTLRGATDPETIKIWVNILHRLYDLSEQFEDDPRQVCQTFSGQPWIDFLRGILGEYTDFVIEGSGMTEDEVRRSVHQGVRIAQNICFCTSWEEYRGAGPVKSDPFGRSYDLISAAAELSVTESLAPTPPMAQQSVASLLSQGSYFVNLEPSAIFSAVYDDYQEPDTTW
jgi:hypothetical protein